MGIHRSHDQSLLMLGTLDLNLPLFLGVHTMVEKRRWSQWTPPFFSSWPRSQFYPCHVLPLLSWNQPLVGMGWDQRWRWDDSIMLKPGCRSVLPTGETGRETGDLWCGEFSRKHGDFRRSYMILLCLHTGVFLANDVAQKKQTNGVRYTTHSKTDLGDSFDESENKSI